MDTDTKRIVVGGALIGAGFIVQSYYRYVYVGIAITPEQIQAWFAQHSGTASPPLCRDESLPAPTCASELWQAIIGIWVGQGVASVGVVILFMPVFRKVLSWFLARVDVRINYP